MGSGVTPAASLNHGGGRAFGLGPRRLLVAFGVLAIVGVAIALLAFGGSHPRSAAALKYGQIPAWLPKPTPPTNQILTATAARPVLAAIEGNTVNAHLSHGSAMVTAVGPAIPDWVASEVQSGSWNDNSTAPSTFTVTFVSPKGVLPLKASSFSILTGEGQVVHPAVTGPHGSPLPARVSPAKPFTLTLKVGLGEGDGALRWAPQGSKVLVAWFYHLELD
jgi:hypothetical protein